jgi:hypothetical protein
VIKILTKFENSMGTSIVELLLISYLSPEEIFVNSKTRAPTFNFPTAGVGPTICQKEDNKKQPAIRQQHLDYSNEGSDK